jgi:hypothetical protein
MILVCARSIVDKRVFTACAACAVAGILVLKQYMRSHDLRQPERSIEVGKSRVVETQDAARTRKPRLAVQQEQRPDAGDGGQQERSEGQDAGNGGPTGYLTSKEWIEFQEKDSVTPNAVYSRDADGGTHVYSPEEMSYEDPSVFARKLPNGRTVYYAARIGPRSDPKAWVDAWRLADRDGLLPAASPGQKTRVKVGVHRNECVQDNDSCAYDGECCSRVCAADGYCGTPASE